MSCATLYNLGCFLSCDQITVPIALEDGDYVIRLAIGDQAIEKEIEVSDSNFVLDITDLPLGREIQVTFFQEGVQKCITVEDVEYCDFKLKLKIPAVTGVQTSDEVVVVKTVTVEFESTIDNGQAAFVDVDVPGMILGQKFTISRKTDLSSLENEYVFITEKIVSSEVLRVLVENQSGEDGVTIPTIEYNIYL